MADKLQELLNRCKCGVFLEVNVHRNYYQKAEESIQELMSHECPPEIPEDIFKVMIETDTIISLQFYTRTPISFYLLYHYDVDKILDMALECLNEEDSE